MPPLLLQRYSGRLHHYSLQKRGTRVDTSAKETNLCFLNNHKKYIKQPCQRNRKSRASYPSSPPVDCLVIQLMDLHTPANRQAPDQRLRPDHHGHNNTSPPNQDRHAPQTKSHLHFSNSRRNEHYPLFPYMDTCAALSNATHAGLQQIAGTKPLIPDSMQPRQSRASPNSTTTQIKLCCW